MALLNNAFQAFGELGTSVLGRPIINKHRSYTFHRPSALWVAQIIVDTIYMAPLTLVFSIIVYFASSLALDAGAFFTFYLANLTAYVAMSLFFRTLGCLSPNFDYAMKIASVILTLFVLTSGYLVPGQLAQAFLKWIFWINAMGLGFSVLMANEFKRVTLRCTGSFLVCFSWYLDGLRDHRLILDRYLMDLAMATSPTKHAPCPAHFQARTSSPATDMCDNHTSTKSRTFGATTALLWSCSSSSSS